MSATSSLDPDGRGQFAPVASTEEDGSSRFSEQSTPMDPDVQGCYDWTERSQAGPTVEAMWTLGHQAWRSKWLIPGAVFLGACLLQSIGRYMATRQYVLWMEEHSTLYAPGGELPQALHSLRLTDHMADALGRVQEGNPRWRLVLDALCWLLPWAWVWLTVAQKNLRLWARTMFAASLLAILKGVCAWASVLPDSAGWECCREQLSPWVLNHFLRSADGPATLYYVEAFIHVLWLWLQDVLFFLRWTPQDLVCSDSFSGAAYMSTLSGLGLYEAIRVATRKLLPAKRNRYRAIFAWLLSMVVALDAMTDIVTGRQYSVNVMLAVVLSFVIHNSPITGFLSNWWLAWRSSQPQDGLDMFDRGDIVVPHCCMPFCFLHGRYYLYELPCEVQAFAQREELARQRHNDAQIREAAERYFSEQQAAERQLLEIEVQLEAVRDRTMRREREERKESERRFNNTVETVRLEIDGQLGGQVRELERKADAEEQLAGAWEQKGQQSAASSMQELLNRERARVRQELAVAQQRQLEATRRAQQNAIRAAEARADAAEVWQRLSSLRAAAKAANAPPPRPSRRSAKSFDGEAHRRRLATIFSEACADGRLEAVLRELPRGSRRRSAAPAALTALSAARPP